MRRLIHTSGVASYLALLIALAVAIGSGASVAADDEFVTLQPGERLAVPFTMAETGDVHFSLVSSAGNLDVAVMAASEYSAFLSEPTYVPATLGGMFGFVEFHDAHSPLLPPGDYYLVYDNSNRIATWHDMPTDPVTFTYTYEVFYGAVTDPFEPRNLTAAAEGPGIRLTWDPPSYMGGTEILNYTVYIGTDPSYVWPLAAVGNVTSYLLEDPFYKGMTNYFALSATNAHGESPMTELVEVMVPPGPPSEPTYLFIYLDGSALYLSWSWPDSSGGSEILHFTVYRGGSLDSMVPLVVTDNMTWMHIDWTAMPGATYYYAVSATNAYGEGRMTEPQLVSMPGGDLPGSPAALSFIVSVPDLILGWLPPSWVGGGPILNYSIYRGPSYNSLELLGTVGNVTTFTDPSIAAGTEYWYAVSATNAFGEGEKNLVHVSVPSGSVPSPPLNLTAEYGPHNLWLNWSRPADQGGQIIYRYDIHYFDPLWGYNVTLPFDFSHFTPEQFIDYCVTGNCSHVFERGSLVGGETYTFNVTAWNSVGESDPSADAVATPALVPADMLDEVLLTYGSGFVNLSWAPPADDGGSPLLGYKVTRSAWQWNDSTVQLNDETLTLLDFENLTFGPEALFLNDTNVTDGLVYFYLVQAFNALGDGGGSVCPVRPGSPSEILGFGAVGTLDGVLLTWSPPANDCGSPVTAYHLLRLDFHVWWGEPSAHFIVNGTEASFLDSTTMPHLSYSYQIWPENLLGGIGAVPALSEGVVRPGFDSPPDPPTGLAVESDGFGLWFNFTAPSHPELLTMYLIYAYQDDPGAATVVDGFTWGLDAPVQNRSTSAHFLNIIPGQTYHFFVKAFNSYGESEPSNVFEIAPYFSPDIPRDVEWTWGNGWVELGWSPPSDDGGKPLTGYGLQRYRQSYNATTYEYTYSEWLNLTFDLGTTSYRDEGLTNGQEYWYYVFAYNEVGRGWMTGPVVKPGAPSLVRNLTGTAGDGYINLTWDPPEIDCGSPVLYYEVEFYDNVDSAYSFETTNGPVTFCNSTQVVNGHHYSCFVTAVNALGGRGDQSSFFITPWAAPSAPLNLTAVWGRDGDGNLFITLTWSPPAQNGEGVSFDLHRKGGMFEDVASSISGMTSHTEMGVFENVTYTYWIVATNGDRRGPSSERVSITPGIPMEVPQALLLVPGPGFVHLFWEAPPDHVSDPVTGYRIYRGTDSGSMALLREVAGTQTDYNDTSVMGGQEYLYSVSALRASGEGERCAAGAVTPRMALATSADPALFLIICAACLVGAAAVAVVVWRRTPWDKKKRIMGVIAAFIVAAVLISVALMAGAMTPPKDDPPASAWDPKPGDFFEYSMFSAGGLQQVKVTVVRVGDTTYTMNFTYILPGVDPIYEEQTGPKNHTEAYAYDLFDLSNESMFKPVENITTETIATKWGFMTIEHRVWEMEYFGMTMSMDLWMKKGMVVRMLWAWEFFGSKMVINALTLTDTNIQAMIDP